MILWNFAVKGDSFIGQVLTFTLLCTSLYSTFIWPGMRTTLRAQQPHVESHECVAMSSEMGSLLGDLEKCALCCFRIDRTLNCAHEEV